MKSGSELISELLLRVPGMRVRKPFKFATWALLFVASVTASQMIAAEPASSDDMVLVRTAAELVAALVPANAHRHIRLLRGDYGRWPLTVPDGVILEGEGIMQLDNGLPAGFEPGTASTIRVAAGFEGDLLTLGNGVMLRALRIEDLKTEPVGAQQRLGNAIVVGSRAAGDTLSATIQDCEIVNPNRPGVGTDGPTGHALVVLTRNPAQHQAPPPHVGANVNARLERSVVRAGGSAMFAINLRRGPVPSPMSNRPEGPRAQGGAADRKRCRAPP
jgi:hypothetical protein